MVRGLLQLFGLELIIWVAVGAATSAILLVYILGKDVYNRYYKTERSDITIKQLDSMENQGSKGSMFRLVSYCNISNRGETGGAITHAALRKLSFHPKNTTLDRFEEFEYNVRVDGLDSNQLLPGTSQNGAVKIEIKDFVEINDLISESQNVEAKVDIIVEDGIKESYSREYEFTADISDC